MLDGNTHLLLFSHIVIIFVLAWEQLDNNCIHTSPTPSGLTPGVLSSATVHTVFTAQYVA
jgi:hypothetical protein